MGKVLLIVIKRYFFAGKPLIGFLVCLFLTGSKTYALYYNSKLVWPNSRSKALNPESALNDKISLVNAHEIGYQAVSVLQIFESVLNSVSFNENTDSELAGYIVNSYIAGQRVRVFFSKAAIVEDDCNPKFELGNSRDITADKYLNNLASSYSKTTDFSIKFSNFVSSAINKKDNIFINIKYGESFGSKYKVDGSGYRLRHRLAEIRADRKGKKRWEALITGIRYYDASKPIYVDSNSVPLVSSVTLANASVFKTTEVSNAMVEIVKDKMTDTQKENEQFDTYITRG